MYAFPIKPMLLGTVKEAFDSPEYIFEWKVDGFRCVMHYQRGSVRLQSKTGRDCTASFPELLAPSINGYEAILDGEVTVLTDGKPDFEGVMGRYLTSGKGASALIAIRPAIFIVWDIIWHNGKSLVNQPLMERKSVLEKVLENCPYIVKIDWVDGKGINLWEAVKEQQLEGMICKKKDSRYIFGRSPSWVKLKNYHESIVNVLGYKPKDGYVLVGTGNKVQGHAMGMGKTEKDALWDIIHNYGNTDGDTTWLPPGIRGRVKFTTLTPKGNMRECHWQNFEL